jgi:glucose dehydrogenase
MKYGVHAGCTHFNSLWDLGVSLWDLGVRSSVSLTCGYKDALRPKRRRKLQAVTVIASMKAITPRLLSSSKFGSARRSVNDLDPQIEGSCPLRLELANPWPPKHRQRVHERSQASSFP